MHVVHQHIARADPQNPHDARKDQKDHDHGHHGTGADPGHGRFERALGHTPEDLQENKWAQGVQKVYTRLQTQLQKLGVTKIEALNQPFDPEFHEAVQVEGDGDTQTVSDVLQNGYKLDSLIIRHATVKVRNS